MNDERGLLCIRSERARRFRTDALGSAWAVTDVLIRPSDDSKRPRRGCVGVQDQFSDVKHAHRWRLPNPFG